MQQHSVLKHKVADSATVVGDTRDLLAFCLAADHGSFTRAARELSESKATISRRIARLEAALGTALFDRTPRAVRVTEDGQQYKGRVTEVLELLGQANDAARGALSTPEGRLRVTWGPEFSAMLAPLVVEFNACYPRVSLDLVVTQAVVDLERERVDVALRVATQLADSSLIAQKVFDLELAIVASPAFLKQHGRPKRPDELARFPVVCLRQLRDIVLPFRHRASGRKTEVQLSPTVVTTEMNCVVEMARADAGLGLVPRTTVLRELTTGALEQVLPAFDLEGASLFLVHRGGRFLQPKVRVFSEFMAERLRRLAKRKPQPR
jgi:DNA-binding transcriptional LysR family regulator